MDKLQPLPCKVSKNKQLKSSKYISFSTLTSGVLIQHKKPLCNSCSHLVYEFESKQNN